MGLKTVVVVVQEVVQMEVRETLHPKPPPAVVGLPITAEVVLVDLVVLVDHILVEVAVDSREVI